MLEYVAIVEQGLVHETNDDAALLNHSVIHNGFFCGTSDEDEGIFGVADGVGSVYRSEMASRLVLNILRECDARRAEEIREKILSTNESLLTLTEQLKVLDVLSTTLCLTVVLGEQIRSYNLGNSRLYRFRKKFLRQLTEDHTKVQKLVKAGVLELEHVREHAESHIITQFLGSTVFEEGWLDEVAHEENFLVGDILMLCSDGVHEYVDKELIREILTKDVSINEMAADIIQYALDAGGYDNATIVLVRKIEEI